MRIEHIGLWVRDLEEMAHWYCKHFDGTPGEPYIANHDNFRSIFISFEDGARLELMTRDGIGARAEGDLRYGWAHLTFSVGSEEKVNALTETIPADGGEYLSGPRVTGDGYYESMLRDPEGNTIEITL